MLKIKLVAYPAIKTQFSNCLIPDTCQICIAALLFNNAIYIQNMLNAIYGVFSQIFAVVTFEDLVEALSETISRKVIWCCLSLLDNRNFTQMLYNFGLKVVCIVTLKSGTRPRASIKSLYPTSSLLSSNS